MENIQPRNQVFKLECEALQITNMALRDLNSSNPKMALASLEVAVDKLREAECLRVTDEVTIE